MHRNRCLPTRVRLYGAALWNVAKARWVRKRPVFISHLITTRCTARCPTCLWRGHSPEVRDTERLLDFYDRARAAGFVSTNLWGGEPLLRDDIGMIVERCHRLGLVTGLVTNGYLLPRRAAEIAPHLEHLVVSVDLPSPAHDDLRGLPGLFDRALEGIEIARKRNPALKILLNAVVSRHSYPEVVGVARLAAELGITATFEAPEEGMPLFRHADTAIQSRLEMGQEQEAFSQLGSMKSAGYPVNNSQAYLRMFAEGTPGYRCHLPQICLRIAPDGTAMNCLHRDRPLGNVYEDSLDEIMSGGAATELFTECTRCHRCRNTAAIETSLFWGFHPEVLLNSLRLFSRR